MWTCKCYVHYVCVVCEKKWEEGGNGSDVSVCGPDKSWKTKTECSIFEIERSLKKEKKTINLKTINACVIQVELHHKVGVFLCQLNKKACQF